MGATITFSSDFSSFEQALDRAQIKLKAFGLEPSKVEKALAKIGDSFSGQRLIGEAKLSARAIEDLGGSGDLAAGLLKLTSDELQRAGTQARAAADKMKALGLEVPPNIDRLAKSIEPIPKQLTLAERAAGLAKSTFGQMFSAFSAANLVDRAVGSIISFGKEAFNSASRITDLSAKLNISTDAIQRWEFVAKQTGATLEDFSGNAFKLGTRLSGGGGSVTKAVEDLGISFEELRRLKPEQQFDTVITKLSEMEDANKRNAIGVALFGRGFESMASAVAQGYGKIAKEATLATKEQLDDLDKIGDEWEELSDRVGKSTTRILGSLAGIALKFDEIKLLDKLKVLGSVVLPPSLGMPLLGSADLFKAEALPAATTSPSRSGMFGQKSIEQLVADQEKVVEVTKRTTQALAVMGPQLVATKASMLSLATATPEMIRSLNEGVPILASWNQIVEKQPLDLKKFENALYALPPAIHSVGVELDAVEEKASGGGGFAAILKSITGVGGLSGALDKVRTGIFEGFGNLISGGLTSLISGGISLLGKGIGALFGKLTGGEGKKVNDLRDAAIAAAGGFDKLNTQAHLAGVSLDKVLSTKKVKDYEAAWKDLQGTLAEYEADQERLQAAIEKYGFTLAQLPAQMRQAELDKQAKELIEDWRVLVGAGFDMVLVNEKMSASIGEYLKTAVQVGSEIPSAMRPILQSLADQGLLVDANGEKITDLEAYGAKFSETWTEGFDRVVKKLDELIQKLQGAGKAIADIPSTIAIDTQYTDSGPAGGWRGDPGNYGDMPAFASGTRGRFVDFGSGTPVLLHGRERVMTEGERAPDRGALETIASALEGIDRRISSAVSRAVSDALILAPSRR